MTTEKYEGKINLILGPMFSGKTNELINIYNRYIIGGKKCTMIKYKGDIRYDEKMITTHDNKKIEGIICKFLYQVDHLVRDYDVICIDEIQFYKDANIFCEKWTNEYNLIVVACGLNGTFDRKPFPIINKLLPLVDNIKFLKAVCRETGKAAIYSQLDIEVNNYTDEIIGGSEKYSAVDRKTFFKNYNLEKYYRETFIEFLQIYLNYDKSFLDERNYVIEGLIKNEIFDKIDYIKLADKFVDLIKN